MHPMLIDALTIAAIDVSYLIKYYVQEVLEEEKFDSICLLKSVGKNTIGPKFYSSPVQSSD